VYVLLPYILILVYLMTLLIAQTIQCQIIGYFINNIIQQCSSNIKKFYQKYSYFWYADFGHKNYLLYRSFVWNSELTQSTFLNFSLRSYNFSCQSRDSAVGTATGYGLHDGGVAVRVPVGSRIFSSRSRPDRFCEPPSLLSNGYRGLFSGGKAAGAWSWPLTSN
jgi:hypothetical protein